VSDAAESDSTGWWSFSDEPGAAIASHVPAASSSRPAWFQDLVELMVSGAGKEDHIAGVVRVRVEDDGGTEFRYRVFRRGDLYRCESLDGSVHAILGRHTRWVRRENDRGIWEGPRDPFVGPPDDYEFGTARPHADRWEGDDFTVPTAAPAKVVVVGRDAWEIELAPPAHKSQPMYIVIDAETGLLLREGNRAFGTSAEWTELDTSADLSDDLFEFSSTDRVAFRYG
jgi:hypothetical protein